MVRCDDWRLGCSLGSFNFTEKLQPEKREKRFSWNWGRCVCVCGGGSLSCYSGEKIRFRQDWRLILTKRRGNIWSLCVPLTLILRTL